MTAAVTESQPLPRVMTIAGSDSGGGAGIEADLKTFTVLGCYGMAAVTAVTSQNTQGVFGIHEVPPEEVGRQIRVVLEDIGADAVKTGMLASAPIIEAVAAELRRFDTKNVVVDPVMVAKSGDALLHETARDALVRRLLPLAIVVTPNVPEAEALSGLRIASEAELRRAAERVHALGPRYVLMKGGHLEGPEAVDYLYDGRTLERFAAPRFDTPHTHGTGCTYASAIAAWLARGESVPEAVRRAKDYVTGAIRHHIPIGRGRGPLNHLWRR
ncbi:MAG TPA: bifunctional hydroxymethylpyrimidine kinase/phosphomethylpyrimidine kinase [Candidatus Hydrogenedentes bacterium]|nr:bifunctional hydroxymethylpyrimidine kinase/phosphomethylpyrimidine kinase [Candidatus Hydrogenedentota bacterium]HNT88403.1 bifunctional hydroxymethylpyrimidine kinase/phosphomethylpyrimidine kinase [Candidatus Hydrogenedentota bacterium]